ncbi:MAG TPA: GNAT family protein [Bacillota bacterium]|nr:GNAT family protein [Bacillota bacterium]
MNPILYSKRLILKVLDKAAAREVLKFILNNKDFLEEWEPRRELDYYSLKAQRKLLIDERVRIKKGQLYKVWIYKVNDPNRIIGSISLNNIVRGVFLSCHLGYRIDQDEQRNGYMTEALQVVINYAFNQLGLHRIEANIMPRNKASLRVVEKLGFYHEGLALKYLKINDAWEDHIHLVLRNEGMES